MSPINRDIYYVETYSIYMLCLYKCLISHRFISLKNILKRYIQQNTEIQLWFKWVSLPCITETSHDTNFKAHWNVNCCRFWLFLHNLGALWLELMLLYCCYYLTSNIKREAMQFLDEFYVNNFHKIFTDFPD